MLLVPPPLLEVVSRVIFVVSLLNLVSSGSDGAMDGRIFNEDNYPKPRVMESHLLEVQRYCFKGSASPVLMSAQERFKHMSLNPPYAMLACIQLVTEVAGGEPVYGDSFLTVLGAPAASPLGEVTTFTETWPGLSELKPIGLELDDDDDPISFIGATTQHRYALALQVQSGDDHGHFPTSYRLYYGGHGTL